VVNPLDKRMKGRELGGQGHQISPFGHPSLARPARNSKRDRRDSPAEHSAAAGCMLEASVEFEGASP
jgi:hypothetical protein